MSDGLSIVNLTASGDLGFGELDIDAVAVELDVGELTVLPGRAYVKAAEGSPTAMIFRFGSYTITGAKSELEARNTVEWLIEILADIGISLDKDTARDSFEVKYLVLKGDIGEPLDLSIVLLALGMDITEYEPEQFPALIHRPIEKKGVIMIFSTGKILITGVQSTDTAKQMLINLNKILDEMDLISEG